MIRAHPPSERALLRQAVRGVAKEVAARGCERCFFELAEEQGGVPGGGSGGGDVAQKLACASCFNLQAFSLSLSLSLSLATYLPTYRPLAIGPQPLSASYHHKALSATADSS